MLLQLSKFYGEANEKEKKKKVDDESEKVSVQCNKYSIPYTTVLGYVACRVTSKLCGIGPAERSWGAVKQIKTGQWDQ